MPHVFVETNWLHAYAAPAHHRIQDAVDLFNRAGRGEFTLHIPNICIGEARQSIRTKCQPGKEANAVRRFVRWAEQAREITAEEATATRTVLCKYEASIQTDLSALDDTLRQLTEQSCVDVFPFDDEMGERATALALDGIAPKPFDHAILAAILVAANRLWNRGERELSFCEIDSDLQPWGKLGALKPDLRAEYDRAHLWVYGDFTLTQPERSPTAP